MLTGCELVQPGPPASPLRKVPGQKSPDKVPHRVRGTLQTKHCSTRKAPTAGMSMAGSGGTHRRTSAPLVGPGELSSPVGHRNERSEVPAVLEPNLSSYEIIT